jgi:hypothetical protein
VIVDAATRQPQFILTGSHNFQIRERMSQSLAGRAALLDLMPCEWSELRLFDDAPQQLFEVLFAGSYPRIHDRGLRPGEWLASYIANYVERDVRQMLNVGDLTAFQTFLGLCAGRSGQLLNLSALGADCGVSHNTAKAWISVLEAGYIVFRLTPWSTNQNSRLIKAPKLYFFDTGILCYLLGIREPAQLANHPLRGAVFETWVVAEVMKSRLHLGDARGIHFFRNRKGLEVDLMIADPDRIRLVEIKSGQTIGGDFFDALDAVDAWLPEDSPTRERFLVYGGDKSQRRSQGRVLSWNAVETLAKLG